MEPIGERTEFEADLKTNLKYMFMTLRLFGIFADKDVMQTTVQDIGRNKGVFKFSQNACDNLKLAFTVLVNILMLGLSTSKIVSFFYGYPEFVPNLTVFRLIATGYFFQVAVEMLILTKMFHSRGRYLKFLDSWKIFSNWAASCGCDQSIVCKKAKKQYRISMAFMVLVLFFNSFGYYWATSIDNKKENPVVIMLDPFERTLANKTIFGFVILYIDAIWLMAPTLFVITAGVITIQFRTLTERIEFIVTKGPTELLKELSELRQAHLKLCDIIEIVEPDFKILLATIYSFNIFTSMFTSYHLIKEGFHSENTIILMSWNLFNVIKFMTVSIAAANLNDTAHAPLPFLFKTDMKYIGQEDTYQLNMFIQKLLGPGIGFSVWGFTLVRRETILTLVGVFLTYFFVLIQFNI